MSKNSPMPGKTPPQADRAAAAQARKQAREALTAEQQFEELQSRPGFQTKERRRLLGQMAGEKSGTARE